ncbi:hypothetical protein [Tahibacter sp.]|uniref:hypothetical protein n=1 Tax=Tahibacter sp. TaxID=2056211 RepID=UPI0028C45C7C|nr:hypothetical protein [Tahibacter sp.]
MYTQFKSRTRRFGSGIPTGQKFSRMTFFATAKISCSDKGGSLHGGRSAMKDCSSFN